MKEQALLKGGATIRFRKLVANCHPGVPEFKKKLDSFYRKIKRWAAKENWAFLFEFSYPDVSKADWIAVILKGKGKLIRMRFERGPFLVDCGTRQLGIIMHQDPVMEHDHPGGTDKVPLLVKVWPSKYDIVCLPLPRGTTGINQWRILAINGCGYAIGVGGVFVAIEHLDFIDIHEENTGVSAFLSISFSG